MARAWLSIDKATSSDGELELRRRGDDFLMTIDGRVLMTSAARRSEEALGEALAEPLGDSRSARVLIAGLGMGHTLRAALDALPGSARVEVAELNPVVVEWCRSHLAEANGAALSDPRVVVHVADVAQVISRAAAGTPGFDAILLDLYVGPTGRIDDADPFYGRQALRNTYAALRSGGLLGIWSETRSQPFEARLSKAGFDVTRKQAGRGGRKHCLYLAYK